MGVCFIPPSLGVVKSDKSRIFSWVFLVGIILLAISSLMYTFNVVNSRLNLYEIDQGSLGQTTYFIVAGLIHLVGSLLSLIGFFGIAKAYTVMAKVYRQQLVATQPVSGDPASSPHR